MKLSSVDQEQGAGFAGLSTSVLHAYSSPPAGVASRRELAERRQAVVDATVPVGGLLRAEAFSKLLLTRFGQPVPLLAHWIVHRRVLSVNWCTEIMVPLFQFERPSLEPISAMREVRAQFEGTLDDWAILEWFVMPNAVLEYDSPARRISHDSNAVVQAARGKHLGE
ncbi:hypothetical protein SNE35_31580 [Paucibacter sp. R3-3]|uniref:Uncharacterized protein n=1 Tax=Roseateles agri TaxID=3098619 RepID=A0ABU5DRX8_9BURK|nr:hypothetical protein [Paucibacter sp. R3-3]MDY0749081.1 hypothetical protein [Paucibacter sp. R3-3]